MRKSIYLAAGVGLAAVAPQMAVAATTNFNVESAPLADALKSFALQSGEQVLFKAEVVQGKRSRRVNGNLPNEVALRKLLSGSNVGYRKLNNGYVISLSMAASPVAQPAAQIQAEAVSEEADVPAAAAAGVDIIVTARKRNETVLTTPATITVMSNSGWNNRNLTTATELNGVIPGLVQMPGTFGLPSTTFRGLGSTASVFSLEPSVAQFTDGVYLGHLRDYIMPVYDLDHIEFIKGTQSTLLGKNTSLGAVSFVNARPKPDFGYEIQLSHSFGIDGNKAQGAVNIPLSQQFQARFAFLASHDDGYGYNLYKRREEARDRELSGRLSLAWRPSDAFDAVFIYQHDDRRVIGQHLELLADAGGVMAARMAALGIPANLVPDGKNTNGSDPLGGTVPGPDQYDRQKGDRLNLIAHWQLGDHTLTSQTAYVKWRSPRSNDYDLTPANLFNLVDVEENRVFSQELRINSPTGQRFQYLAGLYYYDNSYDYHRTYLGSPSNTVGFPLTGFADGFFHARTKAYSAFGSINYEIVDNLKVDAGVRYTHERKEASFSRNSSGALAGAYPTIAFLHYAPKVAKPIDYSVGLQYNATPGLLLYGSYSKGSKSGGYQEFPGTPGGAPFNPETAYSAEIGGKWRFGGNYLTFALYNTRVKGFQTAQATLIDGAIQTVIGNANIRSRGFEGGASFVLAPNFRVGASLVYSDGQFLDDFPLATAAIGRAGDPLVRLAKWSGMVDASYEHDLTGRLKGFASGSLDFASKTLLQFVTLPDAPFEKSRQLLNAKIGVRDDTLGWELAVIGTNLLDQRFVTFTTPHPAGGAGIGRRAFNGTINRPRVVAIQLTLRR